MKEMKKRKRVCLKKKKRKVVREVLRKERKGGKIFCFVLLLFFFFSDSEKKFEKRAHSSWVSFSSAAVAWSSPRHHPAFSSLLPVPNPIAPPDPARAKASTIRPRPPEFAPLRICSIRRRLCPPRFGFAQFAVARARTGLSSRHLARASPSRIGARAGLHFAWTYLTHPGSPPLSKSEPLAPVPSLLKSVSPGPLLPRSGPAQRVLHPTPR